MAGEKMDQPNVTQLAVLHRRLLALRRRRRVVRWIRGGSAAVVILLGMAAVLFALDWGFRMTGPQRALAMAVEAGLIFLALRRYAWPWLKRRESELDVALLVERRHRIDTDLAAALQFETPAAAEWGSAELERAVIEQVASGSRQLDVFEGFPRREALRRLLAGFVAVGIAAVVIGLLPEHTSIFFDRLLFQSRRYPTRTTIETVVVNGQEISVGDLAETPIACAFGQPVVWEVYWSGTRPEEGTIELAPSAERPGRTLVLEPSESAEDIFIGSVPKLVESTRFRVFLGDDATDSAEVTLIPLPTVNVRFVVEPPAYVGSALQRHSGRPRITVPEGSRVAVQIDASKPLRQAVLETQEIRYPLVRVGGAGAEGYVELWELDPQRAESPENGSPEKMPLLRVSQSLAYSIEATDTDGLSLERPIRGRILVKRDRPPRISTSIRTPPFARPSAKPTIYYRATDDHGLQALSVVAEVTHADGQTSGHDLEIFRLASRQTPRKIIENEPFSLELASMNLVKGDRLAVVLAATDYRGTEEGETVLSDPPLVFHVTDQQGILALMVEPDSKSANQLGEMFQLQLGVGDLDD